MEIIQRLIFPHRSQWFANHFFGQNKKQLPLRVWHSRYQFQKKIFTMNLLKRGRNIFWKMCFKGVGENEVEEKNRRIMLFICNKIVRRCKDYLDHLLKSHIDQRCSNHFLKEAWYFTQPLFCKNSDKDLSSFNQHQRQRESENRKFRKNTIKHCNVFSSNFMHTVILDLSLDKLFQCLNPWKKTYFKFQLIKKNGDPPQNLCRIVLTFKGINLI